MEDRNDMLNVVGVNSQVTGCAFCCVLLSLCSEQAKLSLDKKIDSYDLLALSKDANKLQK